MFTYTNYAGEFIILAVIGSRVLSVDGWSRMPKWGMSLVQKYQSVFLRVFYATSLGFSALYANFLHPDLALSLINNYHLTQFSYISSDPKLLLLIIGLLELLIAVFILVGFQLRFVVLLSLFLTTFSIIFFNELVWPNIITYGISLNLLFDEELFSFDNLIDRFIRFGKKY